MVHASKFKTNGDEYLIKVENISDRASFHHYIGYAIPADSSTLQPGGSLSNAVDGEVIDDCIDTGNTRTGFSNFKYFEVLIDKTKENITDWVIFPWEIK